MDINSTKIVKRYFQLNISELAIFKFILESYEGIAMQRTLNAKRGEIEVMIPECNLEVFDKILIDMKDEFFIKEIKKPVDYFDLVI